MKKESIQSRNRKLQQSDKSKKSCMPSESACLKFSEILKKNGFSSQHISNASTMPSFANMKSYISLGSSYISNTNWESRSGNIQSSLNPNALSSTGNSLI